MVLLARPFTTLGLGPAPGEQEDSAHLAGLLETADSMLCKL